VFGDEGARSPSEKAVSEKVVTPIGRAGWAHSLWLNSAPTLQFGEDAKSVGDSVRFANGGQRWAGGGIARGET